MVDWYNQVAEYFVKLETAIQDLEQSVQQIRSLTQSGRYGEIEQAATELNESLQRLDQLIVERQALLQDAQAPAGHRSLHAALRAGLRPTAGESGARHDDAQFLLDQCAELSGRMEGLREDAIALFVCQYNLSETADHLLRLMFPQVDATGSLNVGSQSRRGGRLLDQAG